MRWYLSKCDTPVCECDCSSCSCDNKHQPMFTEMQGRGPWSLVAGQADTIIHLSSPPSLPFSLGRQKLQLIWIYTNCILFNKRYVIETSKIPVILSSIIKQIGSRGTVARDSCMFRRSELSPAPLPSTISCDCVLWRRRAGCCQWLPV